MAPSSPPYEQLVEEALLRPVPAHLSRRPDVRLRPGRADVFVGMRRAGKTYGMWEVLAARLQAGIPRAHLLFVNLEDDRLGEPNAATLDALLETFYRQQPAARTGPCLLCFDEIQAATGWQRFIRRVLDTESAQMLLSGSSAKLLSSEIATSLRGRAWTVEVFPYSFAESLRHHGQKTLLEQQIGPPQRSLLAHHARRYLQVGGFAEIQDDDPATRRRILREYVDVVLLRDIIERHGASNVVALRHLTRRLLADPGGLFSIHRLANDLKSLGIKGSKDTLHAYLTHLQDAYLIHVVHLDSRSERARQIYPRKVYANDTGMALNYLQRPQIAWGALLENWVFLHLRRHFAYIAYVRTPAGYEVDFVVRDDAGAELLVQVCTSLEEPATRARELRALADAHLAYPNATMALVTLDGDEVVEVAGRRLRTVPIWRWALTVPTVG